MTANMYRVGDYVYFETSSPQPYQIRRIEELNKTSSGNVEAKVMCFYRRRDLPTPLIQLADKHQCALDEAKENSIISSESTDSFSTKQVHQVKQRELFLSRQVETLPATHIRGKCSVTLLNETESLSSYLNKDDMFFYCLVFDPTQKTLLADKGEIRVGTRYQCEVTNMLREGESDGRDLSELESLVWTPEHNLTDRQIDQFLVVARSVGTFARALDCSSSVKQPSLHMSAAAASRDITLFHAMDTLHHHQYNLSNALCSLVPSSGPVLCRDEMEEWSASEANLFEEALDKYGKDFNDIRHDFLPWKTIKNIIEYYYMWKTTDRYVQQKRVKAVEAESKLKQVYIPNYSKPNSTALNNNKGGVVNGSSNGNSEQASMLGGKACESCLVTVSTQWHPWGPPHSQVRICSACHTYYKKYGGLKNPSRYGDGDFDPIGKKKSGSDVDEDKVSPIMSHRPHRCSIGGCGKEFKLKAHLGRHYATSHGIILRSGSPRPIMKTRTAFYLSTSLLTKISRRLCKSMIRPRHASRSPFYPINSQAIKQECSGQLTGKSVVELRSFLSYRKKDRGNVTNIATRLGISSGVVPQWLILTDKNNLPKPEKVAFPKPPKAADGTLLYERVPNKPEAERIPLNNISPSLKRKTYEDMNGVDGSLLAGPPLKRLNKDPAPQHRSAADHYAAAMANAMASSQSLPRHIAQINGKPKIAHMSRSGSGRKHVGNWMDAPDDVYFRATEGSKKIRRQVTSVELRRTARKPWRALKTKSEELAVVVLD